MVTPAELELIVSLVRDEQSTVVNRHGFDRVVDIVNAALGVTSDLRSSDPDVDAATLVTRLQALSPRERGAVMGAVALDMTPELKRNLVQFEAMSPDSGAVGFRRHRSL